MGPRVGYGRELPSSTLSSSLSFLVGGIAWANRGNHLGEMGQEEALPVVQPESLKVIGAKLANNQREIGNFIYL